jgi:hypothetical protein
MPTQAGRGEKSRNIYMHTEKTMIVNVYIWQAKFSGEAIQWYQHSPIFIMYKMDAWLEGFTILD